MDTLKEAIRTFVSKEYVENDDQRKLSMGLRHGGWTFSEPPRETFALALGWLVG